MLRILNYLRDFKASVAAIIFLLILQAFGDLALPDYTSKIVDVGIQQGGIERVAPEVIRESELEKLLALMTDEERETVSGAYRRVSAEQLTEKEYAKYQKKYPALETEALYILDTGKAEVLEQVESAFAFPMVMLSYIKEAAGDGAKYPQETVGPQQEGALSEQAIENLRAAARQQLGEQSDTLIAQRAILYIQGEYEAVGMDLGRLQTN